MTFTQGFSHLPSWIEVQANRPVSWSVTRVSFLIYFCGITSDVNNTHGFQSPFAESAVGLAWDDQGKALPDLTQPWPEVCVHQV